ncbi:MAG TPA: HAMP domain-containing sensor histidine kinase [Rhizomicrobium sp.]|jgi:signal transduction histidine kinase|nr:HAMP domain-containing sensor histidine kinase [Rhizomicrobium sp.]
MAQARAVFGPIEAVADTASPRVAQTSRRSHPYRVRYVVAICVVLIAGSFASAALIQFRLDRARALNQAAGFETMRAKEIATDLGATLERYTIIGTAFANSGEAAETSAALAEAGGPALLNILLLDQSGKLVSELKHAPAGFLPLPERTLAAARNGRAIVPSANARQMAIVYSAGKRLVAVQLDATQLMPRASMQGALIATSTGRILAAGSQWSEVPSQAMLTLTNPAGETHTIGQGSNRRLVALMPVPGWPINAGASVATGAALGPWYGTMPLYFFLILGPALAGAGLAVVFVREFERRARSAEAVRTLRSTRPAEARLLIRLADAERRAVEAQRSKAEFIAHMSHELRTPLNAIIGFSEVIENGFFGDAGHPKYVEYAHDIGSAGRNLHTKIGDILEFANIEAGRYPLEPAIVDVAAVTRETIAELAGRAFSRRIRLTVSLPEQACARADALAVKRILTNLVMNAFQYTPEGSAVRVQVRSDDGAIVAAVCDSGIGFAPAEQSEAGQAFKRFDRPGAETGVGMGLAIAMALARRMGGAVQLGGAQGQGTNAELRLPIV